MIDTVSQALSPDKRLGFLVYRAGLAVSRGYERALKPIGVTPTEAGVLSALGYSGPNHIRGLGRLLGIGRQTIVNVTKSLETKQWVTRAAADHDARLMLFSIADAGRQRLAQVEVIARKFDTALQRTIGEHREAGLIEDLSKIVEAEFLAYED